MTTFDRVVPDLVSICERALGFQEVRKACIVRDLKARVRLVLDLAPDASLNDVANRAALESTLASQLGAYFEAPIMRTTGAVEENRLSRAVLQKGKPLEPRPPAATLDRWLIVESRLSRQSWLEPPAEEAVWPVGAKLPVVAFYSFKGGVGRTTALVSCAWQLARMGKRVVVLDLDLEAPGLGGTLGAETDRGVLDVVVDYIATGRVDLSGAFSSALGLGKDGSLVDVFPAGSLDERFLEKLARLDYAASTAWGPGPESPVEEALRGLLVAVKKELKPHVILLDSRSGLHDLSGLSLNALAHVDVLFGRSTPQALEGLRLTASVLAKRKNLSDRPPIVVQAMVDPAVEVRKDEISDFKQKVYDLFLDHVYTGDNAPDLEDAQAWHFPSPLTRNEVLSRWYSTPLAVEEALFSGGYVEFFRRLFELIEAGGAEAGP